MKAFADQRKAKPVFRRHVPTARVDQAGWERSLQRGQIRRILDSPKPQLKLTVGAPDDMYEEEADRVADEVMKMPDPQASSERVQRVCTECEDELQGQPEEEEEELQAEFVGEPLQRQREVDEEPDEELVSAKEILGQTAVVSPEVEEGINSMRGGGHRLPESERHFFELRFGHDFGQVRVHADGRAADMARSVNARAFTVGRNVVFGAGEYHPASSEGRRLLAHELTHTIQQATPRQVLSRASTVGQHTVMGCGEHQPSGAPAGCVIVQQARPSPDRVGLQRNPQQGGTYGAVYDKLTYGLLDWYITDREIRDTIRILSKLPESELFVVVARMYADRTTLGRLLERWPREVNADLRSEVLRLQDEFRDALRFAAGLPAHCQKLLKRVNAVMKGVRGGEILTSIIGYAPGLRGGNYAGKVGKAAFGSVRGLARMKLGAEIDAHIVVKSHTDDARRFWEYMRAAL